MRNRPGFLWLLVLLAVWPIRFASGQTRTPTRTG